MSLNESQLLAVHLAVRQRKNLFLTGQAGVGKSHCIGAVVQDAWVNNLKIVLTATTGIAAMNLNPLLPSRESFSIALSEKREEQFGASKRQKTAASTAQRKKYDFHSSVSAPSTIHKFALLRPNEFDVEKACTRILTNPWAVRLWRMVDIWVIDEVSLLSPVLFDMLDKVARCIRTDQSHAPFGGITMLFTGDFYQLPPVVSSPLEIQLAGATEYCFETKAWAVTIDYELVLEQNYRQGEDRVFAGILEEVRQGRLSAGSIATLRSRTRAVLFDDLVRFASENNLLSDDQPYESLDIDELQAKCEEKGVQIPRKFTPLVSAVEPTRLIATNRQVDTENSARLESLDEETPKTYRMITQCSGRGITSNEQRDAIEDSLISDIMAPSFLELKKGAQVIMLVNRSKTIVNGRRGVVIDFMPDAQDSEEQSSNSMAPKKAAASGLLKETFRRVANCTEGEQPRWPMVLFDNGETLLVKPYQWERESHQPSWNAMATQIPLKLAWAISIHKAQGMTISLLELDLCNVFANGQAYVALSRAKSLDGLLLETFDEAMCTDASQAPNEKVVNYYKRMSKMQKKWKPAMLQKMYTALQF